MLKALQQRTDKTSLILFAAILLYLSVCVIPINIYSDGLFHLNVGRGISEEGTLLEFSPHMAARIAYPETFHVMLALLYMWGGEGMVKFFAPLCGALVAFFVYLLLKPINRYLGVLSGVFSVAFLTHKFIQPLLEPYLLAAAVMSIYFFCLFFKAQNRKYLLLALLFVGLSMSIKQQGLILFGVMLPVGILAGAYVLVKERRAALWRSVPLLPIIPMAISFGPLRDHVERNGELYAESIGFDYFGQQGYEAVLRVVKEYVLGPSFWQDKTGWWVSSLLVPMLVLFVLGAVFLYRKDRLLLCFLLPLFCAEILAALMFGTFIRHYHVIGIAIAPIFLLSSIFCVRAVRRLKFVGMLLAAVLVVLCGLGVFLYNEHDPGWFKSQRCDDQHIAMYKGVGEFIKDEAPRDSIFLAANFGFVYYSLEDGGTQKWIDSILRSSGEEVALQNLRAYAIDYIFLETRQIEKESHWKDYVPSWGLVSFIDESPHFEEVFSVQSDEGDAFILYEVRYEDEGTS